MNGIYTVCYSTAATSPVRQFLRIIATLVDWVNKDIENVVTNKHSLQGMFVCLLDYPSLALSCQTTVAASNTTVFQQLDNLIKV